jgi:hypothetical protein
MPRVTSFLEGIVVFEHSKMIAVLSLCVELTDAYRVKVIYYWHHPIDISYIFLNVKFKEWLSISVLRKNVNASPKSEFGHFQPPTLVLHGKPFLKTRRF